MQDAVEAFKDAGLDLTSVIHGCPENNRPIFYRGAGACPPPRGATSVATDTGAEDARAVVAREKGDPGVAMFGGQSWRASQA